MSRSTASAVDAELNPRGFKRHKHTWNRRRDDSSVEVIDVQTAKSRGSVTMNVGIFDPVVHSTIWAEDPPAVIEEPFCAVRARIGRLMGDTDVWWDSGDPATAAELQRASVEYALPFLARLHDRAAMADELGAAGVTKKFDPVPILSFAVLKHEIGDRDGACRILEE